MTTQKKNKDIPKHSLLLIALIPVFFAGLLGGLLGLLGNNFNALSGFLWGIAVGVVVFIVCGVGFLIWEWIKKEADKGKLLPYLLVGFAVAIAISGLLAVNLGSPSCDESGDPPYSGCVSYADDGFQATSEQKWSKFWTTLPITTIIALLVAVIVRSEMEKKKKENIKSFDG